MELGGGDCFGVSAPPSRASPFEGAKFTSILCVGVKSTFPSPSSSPSSRPADTLSALRCLPLLQNSIASRHFNRGLLRTRKVSEANSMPSPTRTIASKEVARVLA